jgi:peptide/nickel transport system permease protein
MSRMLVGARPTVITGLLGGLLIIGIGATIGVTAGYVGGWVDDLLMRFTDMSYSVPVLPFAIVIIAFLGAGFIESIVVIGLLLWRGNSRVLRAQVLQIRERPYVLAAKSAGAGNVRVVVRHILPNIASMAILLFALGIGYSIVIQAGLAFLGVSSPFVPSWGIMIRNAYTSGYMDVAWWWSIPPGIMLTLTVMSTFMVGRSLESSEEHSDAVARMG